MYVYIIVLSILIVFVGFFVGLLITEYKPKSESIAKEFRNNQHMNLDQTITVTTWNIGYGGLDESRDFFLDGGSHRTKIAQEDILNNLDGIVSTLSHLNSDIILLQEVDINSSRSRGINQVNYCMDRLPEYNCVFSYNFKVPWVPYPFLEQLGRVKSGITTLSKSRIESSLRVSLDGQEPFPKRLFFPKRAMMVHKIPLDQSKVLFIINTHLAAYDKLAKNRYQQIHHIFSYVKMLLQNENHYVIVGGDFNMYLGNDVIPNSAPDWVTYLPDDLENQMMRVVTDTSNTSVRNLKSPYRKGQNFETLIDGFFISTNITVLSVTVHPLAFLHSDHNPVSVTISID